MQGFSAQTWHPNGRTQRPKTRTQRPKTGAARHEWAATLALVTHYHRQLRLAQKALSADSHRPHPSGAVGVSMAPSGWALDTGM
jgi:hypothetical protein